MARKRSIATKSAIGGKPAAKKKPAAKSKKATKTKPKGQKSPELSYDTKTILTVFMLVTLYPVGLVMMHRWMIWPNWLKILVISPLILLATIFLFVAIFSLTVI